jgi:hypothetical protein
MVENCLCPGGLFGLKANENSSIYRLYHLCRIEPDRYMYNTFFVHRTSRYYLLYCAVRICIRQA